MQWCIRRGAMVRIYAPRRDSLGPAFIGLTISTGVQRAVRQSIRFRDRAHALFRGTGCRPSTTLSAGRLESDSGDDGPATAGNDAAATRTYVCDAESKSSSTDVDV